MKTHSLAFLELVQDAKSRVKEISVDELKKRLAENPGLILLDVREDHEWQKGHLPNAQHLGKGIIERDIEKIIPDKSQEIVLYCGGGFRSCLACDSIQKMGYSNVSSMKEGYKGWKSNTTN